MKQLVIALVTMAFASGAFASAKCSAANRSGMFEDTNPSKIVYDKAIGRTKGRK
jgi:hypothetical protein